jgi:2-hydroxyglutarate dehydrogenase
VSQPPAEVDVAVVGAGIVGLAVARELRARHPKLRIAVLEREERIATHQTGRNSGVIHAGIYYAPGSLKARLCVEGAAELYRFCEEHDVPVERCGKLIVARSDAELPALDELERRGHANQVPGLRRLGAEALREIEPHCRGVAALHSPETGVVDFAEVARAVARELDVFTGCGIEGMQDGTLQHRYGATRARFTIFCAGLWSDRLAVQAGADPDPRIVPFRGAYLLLKPSRRELVRSLIYPVPDASLPFLGVHLTRHIDGEVSLGPTAFLSRKRLGSTLAWPGSWRMFRRWWRTGVTELHHAVSRRTLARAAADYVPDLTPDDFTRGFAGVRAQALSRDGKLVDDFVLSETERALHVRNAPSPAGTSALAIARLIADRAEPGLR